jgi:hypothetical protein
MVTAFWGIGRTKMAESLQKILGIAAASALIAVLVFNPDEVVRLTRALTGAGTDVLMAVQGR